MATSTGTSIERGIAFLERTQLPSGTFSLRVGFDVTSDESAPDDHTVFGAVIVAYLLRACGPAARPVVDRAVDFLRGQMQPGGVWRYWTKDHPWFEGVADDLDDTTYVTSLLRELGLPAPDNRSVILANRDRRGLFYTWIVPRRPPPRSARWWRVAARRGRHPRESRKLWTLSHSRPDDVDGIVNANVLAHLGDGPHAAPVVRRLSEVFHAREEHRCDKWYRGQFVFQYAVSRAARAGVSGLWEIRDEACARLLAAVRPDGRIGDGPLDTAMAVSALQRWDPAGSEAERGRACAWLESVQSPDGSWPSEPYYYAASRIDPPVLAWGGEALTTSFCLEALATCRAT
jgi:hypothetical protein